MNVRFLSSRHRVAPIATAALLVAAGCRAGNDLPASPNRLTIVAGADQSVPVGSVVPVAPSVQVHDNLGNSLPGIIVRFTVTAGGGSVTGDSTKTDGRGIATVGQWLVGTTVGTNTLRVTASGIPTAATINAEAVPGAPASMAPVGTISYAALISGAVTPAPAVVVEDAYGNPTPGVTVTFTVTENNGTVTGGTAVTDSLGQARPGSWTLGSIAGINRLTATTANGVSYVFEAQGLDGQPTLAAQSPTDQSGYLHFQVTAIPRVIITDGGGNPVANVPVTFAVTSGDATLSGGDAVTDASGVAAPADWRLGPSQAAP